jgi:hypothetical protein
MGVVRNANAARVGDAFKAGRNVDAVAKNIVVVDYDIADVDTDAKFDALAFRDIYVAQGHAALDFDRATHGIDSAPELYEHAVASGLDDAAAIFGNLRVDQCLAAGFQAGQSAFLVGAHQAAIASDVSSQDSR